jgi:hypothetical protein
MFGATSNEARLYWDRPFEVSCESLKSTDNTNGQWPQISFKASLDVSGGLIFFVRIVRSDSWEVHKAGTETSYVPGSNTQTSNLKTRLKSEL